MTEAKQERAFLQRHLDERIPFDCWWQDAGWYPCDGVGWPKTGTWEVDPVRFPNGLRELSDLMRQNGKKTMVWFEPERVHPGTWLTANHPEWVYGGAGGGLLKLGDPACRAWLIDRIDALLTAQGIDDYRQDFNIDPLPFWRAADSADAGASGDRQGIAEIRHVEGYFAYWDELLRRHPDMLIDSCASGGRRNDLETLRRAVPLLRSDWYGSPVGQQCQTYGLSMWIPYHGTGFIYPKDEYWVRSCMTAENSFGPGTDGVESLDFAELRRLTEQCKKAAPYFLGDFWPLTPYTLDESVWMAWQFNRPELGVGAIQVFRRSQSPYTEARLCLVDLDPGATYEIVDIDGGGGEAVEMSGQDLMEHGAPVRMIEKAKAVVLIYSRT
jgi:alpha-galactosidase